jgi:uncharacterized protein YlxW (UPF0749 family)
MTPAQAPRGAATRGRVDVSTALLNDLLNNTLDPGYRAAAARQRSPRRSDGPMVWLACLAAGLLLVVAYQQSHLAAPARDAARRDLITRIDAAQAAANRMDAQARQLSSDVSRLRDAQLPGSGAGVSAAEVAAGTVAVTGTGMQVELSEPDTVPSAGNGRPGTTPQSQVAVIHDSDLRAVVNELWSAGAEAIAINGARLTPTSFIRVAGESILVDLKPINSPYTVSAIGDRDGLQVEFAQSAIARRLKTLVAVDGITFRFGGRAKLTLPSVNVSQPQYARTGPAATGAPSAAPSSAAPSSGPQPTASPQPTATESR